MVIVLITENQMEFIRWKLNKTYKLNVTYSMIYVCKHIYRFHEKTI